MAIAASGAVSFSDLRTEFSGSGAISFSDLYRGGTLVKGNAGNNTATNLAASVPVSGAINFTNFRSTAKGWRKTFTSGATNQNASTIFGSDYGVNYPKEIVINSGVTLGATSTSEEALEISTGGIGSITITNNGTLIGAGGAAGSAGGDAFEAFVACTFINNGFVYAGGGGGGNGGSGGGGSYTSTSSSTSTRAGHSYGYPGNIVANNNWMWTKANWAGVGTFTYSGGTTSTSYGGHSFSRGGYLGSWYDNSYWRIVGTINSTVTNYSSGGAGGAGGVGAGYNQNAASGSGGASGGQNAGTGGTGGTGAGYGANGSTGNSGANGNNGSGSGGSGGGTGGKYIRGLSFVTLTNNGTVAGGTA